jgi:hypothetical protein
MGWGIEVMLVNQLEEVELPDIIATDKDEQVILIAEVAGFPFDFQAQKAKDKGRLQLIEYLQAAKTLIPFAMLVDKENIWIFRWDGNNLSAPILCLNTADVLSHYEPDFRNINVYKLYMTTLTEAWLRDLAYHWKSEIPPIAKEFSDIDLMQRLEDGTTKSWYVMSNDTVH